MRETFHENQNDLNQAQVLPRPQPTPDPTSLARASTAETYQKPDQTALLTQKASSHRLPDALSPSFHSEKDKPTKSFPGQPRKRKRLSTSRNTDRKSLTPHAKSENEGTLLNQVFGLSGLRVDSFNSFPIESTDIVHAAVDYLITYLAPLLFASHTGYANPVTSIAFPYALQNPDLFESLVTFSQSHRDALIHHDNKPSMESINHQSKAISLLHAKMADSERRADDAAILSNIFLLGAASRFDDRDACETFYRGIRRMIAIRGGLHNLGLGGYVKGCVLVVESLEMIAPLDIASDAVTRPTVSSVDEASQTAAATETQDPAPPRPTLTYPTHPYPPDICALICRLPPGFEELAMKGYLSIQSIAVFVRIFSHASATSPQVGLDYGPVSRYMLTLKQLTRRIEVPSIWEIDDDSELFVDAKRLTEKLACLCLQIFCVEVFTPLKLRRISQSRWDSIEELVMGDMSEKIERELQAWALLMVADAGLDTGVAEGRNSTRGVTEAAMARLLGQYEGEMVAEEDHDLQFARTWSRLREVVGKFGINEKLERDWKSVWAKFMKNESLVDADRPKVDDLRESAESEDGKVTEKGPKLQTYREQQQAIMIEESRATKEARNSGRKRARTQSNLTRNDSEDTNG